MSLINQMLQDLDARRAAHGVGSRLPYDVRPLPKPQVSSLPIIVGVLVLLVLAGGVALFLWETRPQPVPATPALTAQVAEKIVPVEPTTAVPVTSNASTLPELGGSLRTAEIIKPPAEKLVESKTDTTAANAKPVVAHCKSNEERSPVKASETRIPSAFGLSSQGSDKSARNISEATVTANPMIERMDASGSPRERAETGYRKAIAAVNQGRIDEALYGLRNVLLQEPLHNASRQLLVRLFLEAKRADEAVQVLQDGLQGQPAQIGWAMSLARLQVERKDLTGAWQTLDHSLPAAVSNADYQGFTAHVLQRLGRHKEAAEHFQSATRLSPGDGRWWLGLGLALEEEGRVSEAREAFQRARQSGNLGAELRALIEQKLR